MSYDLYPRNKNVDDISFGIFSWPIILHETGMGYVLGFGNAKNPGQYIYSSGKKGSPLSNDGYKVTSKEAKAMALVARGYVSVKKFINKEWEELSESERKLHKEIKSIVDNRLIYNQQTSNEFLSKIELFADFAEKSGGFCIR